MDIPFTLIVLLHASFLLLNPNLQSITATDNGNNDLKTYIIHVKYPKNLDLVKHPDTMKVWYNSLLDDLPNVQSTTGSSQPRIVYSYSHAMTGFAGKFTKSEIEDMAKTDWFLHAVPDRTYSVKTTHSPQFLNLPVPGGIWSRTNRGNNGQGVIIGVVDSGIALGHPSYYDDGMPPPPKKWKGICQKPFICNNKLIGAKSFVDGESPIDNDEGHGTHTSSTAAGSFINDTDLYGNNMGAMSGIAPGAHVAMYKVASADTSTGSAIIAGMGAAIRDGCDIISVSLGPDEWTALYDEPVATGSFSALREGIFVSVSAGNEGPGRATLGSEMPWALTVGASTMDRIMEARVKLGNGQDVIGQSLYQPKYLGTAMRPLVFPGANQANLNASKCAEGAFVGVNVTGKIVLCERGLISRVEKGSWVQNAGGVGMIMMNDAANAYHTEADGHVIAASHVSFADGEKIKAYINSTANPTATILFNGVVTGTPRAPVVAAFSSRGPNHNCPGVLKPDIIGPGVNIVAASPVHTEPQSILGNLTGPAFRMASGTSMSAPHLSGIAALIKSYHPDWSPAAIKSAIMTTASLTDNTGGPILDEKYNPADVLAIGAGHVDATKVLDPGLIYETNDDDYERFLCGLGYTDVQTQAIANRTVDCSQKNITEQELNYPSFAVTLESGYSNVSVKRTVTNVGDGGSVVYKAEVEAPKGVSVIVTPSQLTFKMLKQNQTYQVDFKRTGGSKGFVQGQLRWVSGKYVVRSPISIRLE